MQLVIIILELVAVTGRDTIDVVTVHQFATNLFQTRWPTTSHELKRKSNTSLFRSS